MRFHSAEPDDASFYLVPELDIGTGNRASDVGSSYPEHLADGQLNCLLSIGGNEVFHVTRDLSAFTVAQQALANIQ